MEKRTPHFRLALVKRAIAERRYRFTRMALEGGADMGLDLHGMLVIIDALTARDFHKSMTTYSDHAVWQDVYRPMTTVGPAYLKFTLMKDLLVVSFKER